MLNNVLPQSTQYCVVWVLVKVNNPKADSYGIVTGW